MAVPVFGHHDAAQVGVTAEVNAEEVEYLALVEVGGRPDGGDAVEGSVITCEANDEAHATLQREGENAVADLETRFGGVPVDSGDILEEVVTSGFDCLTCSNDVLTGDGDGELFTIELCGDGQLREYFQSWLLGEFIEYGLGIEDRWLH